MGLFDWFSNDKKKNEHDAIDKLDIPLKGRSAPKPMGEKAKKLSPGGTVSNHYSSGNRSHDYYRQLQKATSESKKKKAKAAADAFDAMVDGGTTVLCSKCDMELGVDGLDVIPSSNLCFDCEFGAEMEAEEQAELETLYGTQFGDYNTDTNKLAEKLSELDAGLKDDMATKSYVDSTLAAEQAAEAAQKIKEALSMTASGGTTTVTLPPTHNLTNVTISGKVPFVDSESVDNQEDTQEDSMATDVRVASLIPNAEKLIEEGFNVMLIGRHGTGKTESVRQLATDTGLKLKAYSCATLDPFTDLVGVPVPQKDKDGRDYLKMVRPIDIDEAEIVFFDELNRSRPEVQDAVLEIINNRTINGEPLPNLKACWAAINPPNGEYNVDELDPALMDRFDLYIEFAPNPSVAYMSQHVSKPVALALKKWWDEHDKSKRKTYISPRRLMKIGLVFEATKNKSSVFQSLPPEADMDSGKLWQMLDDAAHPEKAKKRKTTMGSAAADFSYDDLTKLHSERKQIAKFLKDEPLAQETHRKIAKALENGASGQSMISTWAEVINELNKPTLESLINGFSQSKQSKMRTTFASMMKSNKARAKKLSNLHSVLNEVTKQSSSKLPPL